MRKIGFVILTWNSQAYIERCLRALATITAFDLQIEVIENGSKDNTPEILERLSEEPCFRDIMHITRFAENQGTTVSRNAGLKQIRQDVDYVCILDSDTEVNEAAFLGMVSILEQNPQIGIIGPKMKTDSGVVQMSGRNIPTATIKLCKGIPIKKIQAIGERMERPSADMVDGWQKVGYLMSACWLIPKHVADEAGGLDEKIFYAPEDVEYCIRVQKAGYEIAFYPEVEIIHSWQRISKKKLISKTNWEHVKGIAYLFSKYHYIFKSPL